MGKASELLKKRYIYSLKEKTDLLIGIELELPLVSKKGKTDSKVTLGLLKYLSKDPNYLVLELDRYGNVIALKHVENDDMILFEVSDANLEFAFSPEENIHVISERFETYKKVINAYLNQYDHYIGEAGIHPNWQKNTNLPIAKDRYEMLIDYLKLGETHDQLHSYYNYGSFICGSQVQIDVTRSNYLSVINAFNQIEAAKAYLFANSKFKGENWDTSIARDIFWEQSMHGLLEKNVGLPAEKYKDEAEFLDALTQTAMYTVVRDKSHFYFEPVTVAEYFKLDKILAKDTKGKEREIHPKNGDIDFHRSYLYQSLTTRSTVEFRSVCAQPFDRTFAPAAFHLGLMVNLEKMEDYLKSCTFFDIYGHNYKKLRRAFSQLNITEKMAYDVKEFAG